MGGLDVTAAPQDLRSRIVEHAMDRGVIAVGITTADAFVDTAAVLVERRDEGLSADMAFTYRNPSRSTDITKTFPWARSIVVGAWPYPGGSETPVSPDAAGRIGAYVWEPYYAQLRQALETVGDELRAAGYRANVVADDNALVDRAAAVRAGIGWWGKNTNVLIPNYGSFFVLGNVVTDAELAPDTPIDASCGGCRRCLDGCPTGAIVQPGVLDARRCLAWLVQSGEEFPHRLRPLLGGRIYGCDDCQLVCPPNRHPEQVAASVATTASLVEILDADDGYLLERFGTWYIPKRQPRYLRRNALIAWANTADLDDESSDARLTRLLADGDPMIVAYAIWAARHLGRYHLLASISVASAGSDEWQQRWQRELTDPLPPRQGEHCDR